MFNEFNGVGGAENYIHGFPLMPNSEIPAFLSANNLSFTVEQLIFIRDYYRNEKKAIPTYNQILFLDTINKIRKSQKKEYSVYSATADVGADATMQSSKDLLAKSKAIKRSFSGAMPLSFASEIASEYLKNIGYAEQSNYFSALQGTQAYDYYIHAGDNKPMFVYSNNATDSTSQTVGANAQPSSNPLHNTIVMLFPLDGVSGEEYSSRVNELLSLPEISAIISDHTVIKGEYGLFDILSKETNGIYVNLSTLPQIEKDENGKVLYLTSLLLDFQGKHIFSTNNASCEIINRIAERYSLRICAFANKNNSRIFALEPTKNPAFSFAFSFLNRILNFKEHHEYIFTDETNSAFGQKRNVYITNNHSLTPQTHSAQKILNFGKTIASVSSRDLDFSPHKSAAITVIDSLNTLIAKGVSKNSISLSIYYSLLNGTDDSRELGKNLASVLGAYRSMIELCVSDTKPQISYNPHSRSITVLSAAKPPKMQIKSVISDKNSHVYFYNLKLTQDGLPDYQKYRAFIKYYYSLLDNDIVLSALAVNENFLTVFQSAAQNTNINVEVDFDSISHTSAHGILFETREMIAVNDDIFYIGSTEESQY